MDNSRKRGFSYYFKIEISTIQGRLTTAFLIVALLAFVLVLINTYQWKKITDNRNELIEVVIPLRNHATALLNNIKKAQNSLEKSMFLRSEIYLQNYEKAWSTDVKRSKDSLEYYVNILGNDDVKVLYSKINNEITNLKRSHKQAAQFYTKIQDSKEVENLVQNTFIPFYGDIEKNTQELITIQKNIEKQYKQRYEIYLGRLPWVLLVIFLGALSIAGIVITILTTNILGKIRTLKNNLKELAKGNIPENLPESSDELNSLIKPINTLTENLREIKNFSLEVGKGSFDSQITVFGNIGELGTSLSEMKSSLKNVYEEERRRNWTTEGLARFSEILRNNSDNLEVLSNQIISNLIKYLHINQGGIFIIQEDKQGERFFELKACYAYNKKKAVEKKIMLEEGLLGQAYHEKNVVYLKEIPPNYTFINSGLGFAQPNALLVVPLMYNDEINGMLELASFEPFENYQIEFLKKLGENLAATIANVQINQSTRNLLQDSQGKTQAIRIQEEELRQNTEELKAIQEDLSQNLMESEKLIYKLSSIIDAFLDPTIVINQEGIIEVFNEAAEELLGYAAQTIIGSNFLNLLMPTDKEELESILQNHAQSESQKVVDKARKVKITAKGQRTLDITINISEAAQNTEEKIFIISITS